MNKEEIEYCGLKIVVNNETYTEYKGTLEAQIEILQQENKQLKEKLDKYKEVISKFKDLKTLIGILNSNNLRFSFNEILQELEKGDSNE